MTEIGIPTDISIVMPVHNEEELLEANLGILSNYLENLGLDYEIIICENGSHDRTFEIAERLSKNFPRLSLQRIPFPSLGEALRVGFKMATKSAIIFYPADLSHDINFIPASLSLLGHYDVVYASRNSTAMDRPFTRKILTKVHPFIINSSMGTRVTDIGSLKLYRREVGQRVMSLTKSLGSFIEVETAVIMHRLNYSVIELPIIHNDSRKSRFSIGKMIWNHSADFIREFRYLRSLSELAQK